MYQKVYFINYFSNKNFKIGIFVLTTLEDNPLHVCPSLDPETEVLTLQYINFTIYINLLLKYSKFILTGWPVFYYGCRRVEYQLEEVK